MALDGRHLVLTVLTCWALTAVAQTYPVKPIRVIVGFAPSGGTDIAARTLGQKLARSRSGSRS